MKEQRGFIVPKMDAWQCRFPPRRRRYVFPFDTGFDTASHFWVLNGVTRQHGARTWQRRLCDEITRNHERADSDKTLVNIDQN
jgi:hypothetical protein